MASHHTAALLVLLAALTAPSCGGSDEGPAPAPAAPSCAGCVSDKGCVPFAAESAAACGAEGYECRECPTGAICQSGKCKVDPGQCSPLTCPAGCCAAGVCRVYESQTPAGCGIGGALCASCPTGEACSFGQCVKP